MDNKTKERVIIEEAIRHIGKGMDELRKLDDEGKPPARAIYHLMNRLGSVVDMLWWVIRRYYGSK